MTLKRTTSVECDICGCSLSWTFSQGPALPLYAARQYAKSRGWKTDKEGRDVCDKHVRSSVKEKR